MIYCVNCEKKLNATEITKPKECPKCKHEIHTINNAKLTDLLDGLTQAALTLNSSLTLKSNPKQIVEIAKVIERGEKALEKEHAKRIEQLKEIQYEKLVIESYALTMGYESIFRVEKHSKILWDLPNLTVDEVTLLRSSNEHLSEEEFYSLLVKLEKERAGTIQ